MHTKRPSIDISASHGLSMEPFWSPWSLYDGRFWFRFQNLTTTPLVVRPFRKTDLKDFRHSIIAGRKTLGHALKELAPEAVRWTLPAIATEGDGKEKRVLALPTLGVGVLHLEDLVRYEVRYKKVDMNNITIRERLTL